MEPTDLTCQKCGKSWKLIKAGAGAVTCPHCQEPLNQAPVGPTAVTSPAVATEPAPASPPSTPPSGLPQLSLSGFADTDDPGLRADYAERDPQPRSGRNPLTRVILILVLLFLLVPVAVLILLLIVRAVMIAAA
jgi:hypothetical protein